MHPSNPDDHDLPCAGGLLAATLALLTGWAMPNLARASMPAWRCNG